MDLPLASALFVVFALTLYVLLDGFDLGIGALLLTQDDARLRDQMIDSIAPTWDGNETWLVMAAIALFAGFPIAYGILLPALYLPLIVMLLALGIRGVTFEFRVQSAKHKRAWDVAFGIASVAAALAQGAAAATVISGISVEGGRFAGSVFDSMNVLSVVGGFTLLAAYMMLGAGWLWLKEQGALRSFAGRRLRVANLAFLVLAILAWTLSAAAQPQMRSTLSGHQIVFLFIALAVLASAVAAIRSTGGNSDHAPFAFGVAQCAVSALGLWLIVYPDVVPFRVTLWDAASSTTTHVFLLTGAAIITPLVITYSAFAYRVFRGKTPVAGYES